MSNTSITRRYRMDMDCWEERHVFNKTIVWYKYMLFDRVVWNKGKAARGRAKYFNIDNVFKPSFEEVQEVWKRITGL